MKYDKHLRFLFLNLVIKPDDGHTLRSKPVVFYLFYKLCNLTVLNKDICFKILNNYCMDKEIEACANKINFQLISTSYLRHQNAAQNWYIQIGNESF
jgi:hypothetical protein